MSIYRELPSTDVMLQMEPEELAPLILRYLKKQPEGSINRHNFSLAQDYDFNQKHNHNIQKKYAECLMEAWMYLERQGFIAPKPGQTDDWAFVTRKGQKVVDAQNFETYNFSYLLPAEGLDPILLQKVRASFIRGDYDTAVFQAFKEVEIRVRDKAKLTDSDYGLDLITQAFKTTGGILTNKVAVKSEQVARFNLFAGAIGTYKNPPSHRDVVLNDPKEVADIIHFANLLLRILESLPK